MRNHCYLRRLGKVIENSFPENGILESLIILILINSSYENKRYNKSMSSKIVTTNVCEI